MSRENSFKLESDSLFYILLSFNLLISKSL